MKITNSYEVSLIKYIYSRKIIDLEIKHLFNRSNSRKDLTKKNDLLS